MITNKLHTSIDMFTPRNRHHIHDSTTHGAGARVL